MDRKPGKRRLEVISANVLPSKNKGKSSQGDTIDFHYQLTAGIKRRRIIFPCAIGK